MDLAPDDRPTLRVDVADADEAAILRQELGVEIVDARMGGAVVVANAAQAAALKDLGYQLSENDPYKSELRLVRLLRNGRDEPDFAALGLKLYNREAGYWTVSGDLASVRAAVAAGWSIEAVSSDEPRPRSIRVALPDKSALDAVYAVGFDVWAVYPAEPPKTIYRPDRDLGEFEVAGARERRIDVEATRAAREKQFEEGPIVVDGAAFDAEIDALRKRGHDVSPLDEGE
ncbi:MAG: hypothetical protein ACFB00_03695 [Parvularculaceae bacterium]